MLLFYQKKGLYHQSIHYAYKSLEFLNDQNTIYIPITYHLLASSFYQLFDYQKSLSLLFISKNNYEKYLLNLNNQIGASLLNDIATCFIKLNNYKNALEYATESFQIRNQLLPLIDLQNAESYSTLAFIYSKQQQHQKSNGYINKALQLSKQLISNQQDIENIQDVFENIAQTYFNQNNFEKSRKYYKKALKYTKIYKLDDHPDIQRLQNIIDQLPKTYTNK